jgi:hypothetical protein
MKRTMHFHRVDKLGKLRNCAMGFNDSNSGLFFERGGLTVDLSFEAMRGVHEMIIPEGLDKAGEPVHRDLLTLMPALAIDGNAERAFMVSFSYKDDTTQAEMDEVFDPQEAMAAEKVQSKFRGFLARMF